MKVERKGKIIQFYNHDGIAYGYVVETDEGYRMAWYAGIVMSDAEMREAVVQITKFLNYVVVS